MRRARPDREEADAVVMAEHCYICDNNLTWQSGLVLVQGRFREAHCSNQCLDENLRRRYHLPAPEWISTQPPDPLPEAPLPEPVRFGPAWPPTDADWAMAFARAPWVYPLPGPNRRALTVDAQIFAGADGGNDLPALCREDKRCGVDLGGDLWGEHVYAAHDGVVERVRANGADEGGGQFVRLSHFGGMVFTQYFHLAAVPRGIVRGLRVKAGDMIGLLGDSGVKSGRRHLHFALSVRPSSAFPETYWDPRAMMVNWPLRQPAHGTVAGYVVTERPADGSRRRRLRY